MVIAAGLFGYGRQRNIGLQALFDLLFEGQSVLRYLEVDLLHPSNRSGVVPNTLPEFALRASHTVTVKYPERDTSTNILSVGRYCRIGMVVSRFTRAYNTALTAADITRTAAASLAGMKQSVLSRLLNDERPVYAEHVAQMLKALPEGDREHCLRAFLTDQVPEEFREKLIVNFGSLRDKVAPDHRRHDRLSRDLLILEKEAEDNPDLRKVISNLAALVLNSGCEEQRAAYHVETLLDSRSQREPGGSVAPKAGAVVRAGRDSSESEQGTKPGGKGGRG